MPSMNKLARKFEKTDYTKKIIRDPEKYIAEDVIALGSLLHKIAVIFMGILYPFLPDYIWLLRKNERFSNEKIY